MTLSRACKAIFFLILFHPTTSVLASNMPETSYRIVFSAENLQTVSVRAEVTLADQKLRMASWGHPHLPRGWATFVRNLKVTNIQGSVIHTEKDSDETWGSWEVDAEDGERLLLQYDIEFTHDAYDWSEAGGQDSRPSINNGALFLVTKALFIYSPGTVEGAEVEVEIPEGWVVSSPWPSKPANENVYVVDSWISLVNNALVVGDHKQHILKQDGMTIILALDSGLEQSSDIFESTIRKQLGAYVSLFGGAPESQYLVTIRLANEDDGESFENSFNQVITPGRHHERSIVWANTMGHELFHYWNGNHFLVGTEKEKVEWFSEGFTEYYSSLTLLRTALIDERLWFRKLETYLARYFVTTQMWPVDTPTLVDAGGDKHQNWLRIYGGGATMALVLDIEIRSVTNGQSGLDEVMRLLKDRFGHAGASYGVDDILDAINTVSSADFSSFFDSHISGYKQQLEIGSYLEKAGINVEQFSDEFYLSRISDPNLLQQTIFNGMTGLN